MDDREAKRLIAAVERTAKAIEKLTEEIRYQGGKLSNIPPTPMYPYPDPPVWPYGPMYPQVWSGTTADNTGAPESITYNINNWGYNPGDTAPIDPEEPDEGEDG